MVLQFMPGIGQKISQKLTQHFGSEHLALMALKKGDFKQLTDVEGISEQKAADLIDAAKDANTFLATKEAVRLHKSIMQHIAACANNNVTKENLMKLQPAKELVKSRQDLIKRAMKTELEINGLKKLNKVKTRFKRVVVSPMEMRSLEPYCRIIKPESGETWQDYTVFKEVTWVGDGGPLEPPSGWIVVPETASETEILPEFTLEWFQINEKLLRKIDELTKQDELKSEIAKIQVKGLTSYLDQLKDDEKITQLKNIKDQLWTMAKKLETDMQKEVDEAMSDVNLQLDGSDMLRALQDTSTLQRKLKQQTSTAISKAVENAKTVFNSFLSPSGMHCPDQAFSSTWPTKISRQIMDQMDQDLEQLIHSLLAQKRTKLSKQLAPIKQKCELAWENLIQLDMWLTVGKWARENEATMPQITSSGFHIQNGRHLLIGEKPDPISYGMGESASKEDCQEVTLLTGANSGGKTTLLEMIAHHFILAHMGFPVPAENAKIGHIESLHVLAKAGGTQSAGALEQTLMQLAEVVSSPTAKLILADELEAITEPGAGAKIIAGMLEAANKHEHTCMLLVTHLAKDIMDATELDLRVDGIEAKGLNQNLELIVDRNPRRNYLARSTPELIVKRLVQRASGSSQEVFTSILERF